MTPQGLAMLKDDEGCELTAYPDPLSGGEPWTVGWGHTGGVTPGFVITQGLADGLLAADVKRAEAGLHAALPWFVDLDAFRQDVLTNMAFNMGVAGLLTFGRMLTALHLKNWKDAAAEMLNSAWARQVKGRAYRLAAVMEHGYEAL